MLLCYVTTAVSYKSRKNMINSVISYYELKKIREAKEMFFSYCNSKNIKRRGEYSELNEVNGRYFRSVK